jgi:hypothetical protein
LCQVLTLAVQQGKVRRPGSSAPPPAPALR